MYVIFEIDYHVTQIGIELADLVAGDDLELLIFLLPPPELWDCRYKASYPVYVVLRIKPRDFCTCYRQALYKLAASSAHEGRVIFKNLIFIFN